MLVRQIGMLAMCLIIFGEKMPMLYASAIDPDAWLCCVQLIAGYFSHYLIV